MKRLFTSVLIPYLCACLFYNTAFADVFITALVLLLLFSVIRRKNVSVSLISVVFCIIAFSLSSDAYSLKNKSFYSLIDQPASISCMVCSTPEPSQNGISFTAELLCGNHNGQSLELDGKALVYCDGTDFLSPPAYGDVLEFKTTLTLPQEALNDGMFDYRRHLNSQDIFITCNTHDFSVVNHGRQSVTNPFLYHVYRLRDTLIKKCDTYFDTEVSSFLKAFLLGYRADMPEATQNHINRSGISHIISISGMHVSVLMVIFSFFIRKLKFRLKVIITPVLNLAFIIFIPALTGFSPSVLRASLMLAMSGISSLLYRENDSIHSLSFAVLVLTLINPCAIYDTGLMMSATSVLGIILLSTKIRTFFLKFIRSKVICENISITLSAQIATLPLSVYCFSYVSLLSIFTNLIVLPFIFLLMSLGAVFLISPFEPITQLVSGGIWIIIKFILLTAKLISSVPFATVSVSFNIFITAVAVFAAFAFSVFAILKTDSAAKQFSCFLIASAFIICMFFPPVQKDFSVTAINTNRGDCTLIRLKSGETIMVDCGSSYYSESNARSIYSYLLNNGITRIDYAVTSSFSENNIKNMLALMEYMNFGSIIAPDYLSNENADTVSRLYTAAKASNTPVYLMQNGDSFSPGEGVLFEVLMPESDTAFFNGSGNLVFSVSYANRRILFSGDICSHEKQLLSEENICAGIIKLPNSGKHDWANKKLLASAKPSYAFAFTGKNPLPEKTMELLADFNIIPFSTGVDKTIEFNITEKGNIYIH